MARAGFVPEYGGAYFDSRIGIEEPLLCLVECSAGFVQIINKEYAESHFARSGCKMAREDDFTLRATTCGTGVAFPRKIADRHFEKAAEDVSWQASAFRNADDHVRFPAAVSDNAREFFDESDKVGPAYPDVAWMRHGVLLFNGSLGFVFRVYHE